MVITRISPLLFSRMKMTPLLDKVVAGYGTPEKLNIANPDGVESLLKKLMSAGPQSLQVITDFDATLTRYHLDGKACQSSYGMIVNCLGPKLTEKILEINGIYNPIEIDVRMSVEEKTPHMLEWYRLSHECMLSAQPPLRWSNISEVVKKAGRMLRDNSEQLLQTLNKFEIPTLVLSAGMGNMVEEVLKTNSLHYPNMKIMANFMEFDESGVLKGFSEPLIHIFNKNEAALHNDTSGYFEKVQTRKNVLLLGDSLGDINMATGIKDADAILRIGFLNEKIQDHLSAYMKVYDVVLTDDQSMDFVNSLLKLVVNSK